MSLFEHFINKLQEENYKFSWEVMMGETPRITFEGIRNDEIIFKDNNAYLRYETHDNCSECGSPTNYETKTKEITLEDLERERTAGV